MFVVGGIGVAGDDPTPIVYDPQNDSWDTVCTSHPILLHHTSILTFRPRWTALLSKDILQHLWCMTISFIVWVALWTLRRSLMVSPDSKVHSLVSFSYVVAVLLMRCAKQFGRITVQTNEENNTTKPRVPDKDSQIIVIAVIVATASTLAFLTVVALALLYIKRRKIAPSA